MFQLAEESLRLKEGSVFIADELIISELSKSTTIRKIQDLAAYLEENLHGILQPEQMDLIRSFLKNCEDLDPLLHSRVADSLIGGLRTQIAGTADFLSECSAGDFEAYRESLEAYVFFAYWFVTGAERKLPTSTSTMDKSKKKKIAANEEWNWFYQKQELLCLLSQMLDLDIRKLFTLMNERAPFMSLIIDMTSVFFESEINMKDSNIKNYCLKLLASCVCKFDQASAVQMVILQNLRYSTFLAETMADLLHLIINNSPDALIFEEIFREIGNIEFEPDDKIAKEFSKFIVAVSATNPKETLRNMSMIQSQLDSDSYTIRCGMIEVIGNIMAYLAKQTEYCAAKAESLCQVLEGRVLDISSYCRARVLKTFCFLCNIDFCEGNESDGTVLPKKNAIPIQRRHIVTALVAGRLHDKTSIVRKEAIRVLLKFIETHPFWLDGGTLDFNLMQQRLHEHQRILDEMASNADDNSSSFSDDIKYQNTAKKLRYYQDAAEFASHISSVIPVAAELLASKSKTDVLESMNFFVTAYRFQICNSNIGIKKMIHLVWSKDSGDKETTSIKEHLIQSFLKIYIDINAENEDDRTTQIVQNLVKLTFNTTLADLTSLEQLISELMTKNLIPGAVLNQLWSLYSANQSDLLADHRRGAIIIIGMLTKNSRHIIVERLGTLVKTGFGTAGKSDFALAKYTCIALSKLGSNKKVKGGGREVITRYPANHPVFTRIMDVMFVETLSMDWFSFAEEALNLIYNIADCPEVLVEPIIRKLWSSCFSNPSATSTFSLAKLLFIAGHAAIREIAFLETVENELKSITDVSDASKTPKKKDVAEEDLGQVVGSVEDDVGERFSVIRERELLFGGNSILSVFGPMVRKICADYNPSHSPIVKRMAVLALCKFMCVSEKFCEGNLSLLLSLLEKATDPHTRSNIIVALGDIAVCFNNLIDQNISHLYHRLNDADQIVKKNALMVLTHLILNGMVKVKGQISLMAKCIEDEDVKISDLAKLFFAELSQKDNAIYNNLPDIISSLSAQQLDDGKFRNIMRYLFNFIDKERQAENLVEKLCFRFKNADSPKEWGDVAFCLSLLPYNSEKSFKKLVDNIPLYYDKLYDNAVYKLFCDIVSKARKFTKPDAKQTVEEFEAKIQSLHNMAGTVKDQNCELNQLQQGFSSLSLKRNPPVKSNVRSLKSQSRRQRQPRGAISNEDSDDYANVNSSDRESVDPENNRLMANR